MGLMNLVLTIVFIVHLCILLRIFDLLLLGWISTLTLDRASLKRLGLTDLAQINILLTDWKESIKSVKNIYFFRKVLCIRRHPALVINLGSITILIWIDRDDRRNLVMVGNLDELVLKFRRHSEELLFWLSSSLSEVSVYLLSLRVHWCLAGLWLKTFATCFLPKSFKDPLVDLLEVILLIFDRKFGRRHSTFDFLFIFQLRDLVLIRILRLDYLLFV